MIYLESNSRDPYFNLALEEYVFNEMDKSREYFMLWQNDNTIVVGKYQNTAEEINQAYVDEHNIKVARRLSGGGAVYHDTGNLNFTFIVGSDTAPDFDFKVFVQPVIRALASLGVKAEFTGRNDITIDGKKFSGNSQYARKDRIMHHGCIMVDSNLNSVGDALKPKEAKFESKSTKSVRSRVTTINANSETEINVEVFKEALKKEIFAGNRVDTYELTEADLTAVEKLAEEKYATWEWNYGKSASYNFQNEKKYDFGLVGISAQVKDGIIEDIHICGDFFGNGEISELENALKGLRTDTELSEALKKRLSACHDVDFYIKGMTAYDIQNQLRL